MNTTFQSQIASYAADYQSRSAANGKANGSISGTKPTLTADETAILAAAAEAWKNYENSAEGKAHIASMQHMSALEVQNSVQDLLAGDIFKAVRELIDKISASNFPIKSFSIGLNFEAEFIIGVTGTIGGAIGVGDASSAEASTFLSLGVDEGVEAGALGGVQFGLWRNSPQDLGGFSYGAEILFDDGIGGSFGVYCSGWELSLETITGLTLTLGAGADDGIEFQESYTFVLGKGDFYLKPVYQPRKNHFLILTQLRCENIAGGDGSHNEIYFTFQADGDTVYPYPTYDYFAMAEGDSWNCGRSVMFDNSIKIVLWDADDGPDDNLGNTTINYSDLSVGSTKTYSIYSKNGFDERQFYIDAQLLY